MQGRPAQTRAAMLLFTATLLVPAACTGGSDDGHDGSLLPPSSLEASLTDGADPRLVVAFAPVDGADAYLLQLDSTDTPIRIEPDGCPDHACQLTLDRLSAAGATTATVASVQGETVSEPSDAARLPDWPAPSPAVTQWPADQPVLLAVTRADSDGTPVVEFETVPVGGDVQVRIDQLKAEEGILGAGVAGPVRETDSETEWPLPDGETSWQIEAMNFDALPPDPRGTGIVVALLDDGIYPNHPNIDQATISETNILEPGRDAPGDHATAMASLIVGEHTGVVHGVATGVTIHAYDIHNQHVNEEGELDTDVNMTDIGNFGSIAEAIITAVDNGARVINVSQTAICMRIGSTDLYCPDDVFGPAIRYAEEQGVVVVASAGNDGSGADYCPGENLDSWPAAFGSVITVGATERDGSRWPCTPDKEYIDVHAPGANLMMADSPDGYWISSGTSAATALVSGLVATALAENRDLTPAEIRTAMSYATDENGRLIAEAFLRFLGIGPTDEPIVDVTTGRQFIPFSVGLGFDQGSQVWRLAGLATSPRDPAEYDSVEAYQDDDDQFYPWTLQGLDWSVLEPFRTLIGGMLVVDSDGDVTGSGSMQLSEVDYGHTVECPEHDSIDPELTFTWNVPVTVSGQVIEGEPSDDRTADLTLSLGEGATAQEHGTLPEMTVIRDDFADCEIAIARRETPFTDPRYPWSEVRTWPDQVVELRQAVYEQIVGESPFRLEDGFFPPREPERDAGPYTSGGVTDGGVDFDLRIGDINFRQLS
ncbi:S8 family peptidase [Jiangella asiatica]|uniref:Peptidase S8/S53 domain-containing protein n=1 Tax=Jiangella asiatica TaxID=2530372 RepID=A0A4V2Z3C6_9ACTN|nr:S8/S53 family peptidase [Jiangella asiatica]TDE12198.1 hypothetical protein E1269_07860 [Jiangella asiatica]